MLDEIIAPLFSTTWGRRTGWGLLILSTLMIVFILIKMPTTLLRDWRLVHAKKTSSPVSLEITTKEHPPRDFAELHLFGSATPEVTDHLPITSLQLSLLGVLHSNSKGHSRVIISEGGQPGKVYKVNDLLPSGVRIAAIDVNGVTLENAGRMEKLPLQRTRLIFQSMPKPLLIEE